MPRWRFWENTSERSAPPPARTTATRQSPRRSTAQPIVDPERAEPLSRLRRRREAALFDVEQSELALRPENPWRERSALLDEVLATVDADRAALALSPPRPAVPLPPAPIAAIRVTPEEPASVSFRVGMERFWYEDDIDWAERGTTVVHGELQLRGGVAAALIPKALPADRRAELEEHLTASLFVFATDLRDRAVAGDPLPASPTLADLARPCPECGGWRDWHGTCLACKRRDWRRQQLCGEAERLQRERARAEEERARWADRLPIARRRLADVDAEIAALGG